MARAAAARRRAVGWTVARHVCTVGRARRLRALGLAVGERIARLVTAPHVARRGRELIADDPTDRRGARAVHAHRRIARRLARRLRSTTVDGAPLELGRPAMGDACSRFALGRARRAWLRFADRADDRALRRLARDGARGRGLVELARRGRRRIAGARRRRALPLAVGLVVGAAQEGAARRVARERARLRRLRAGVRRRRRVRLGRGIGLREAGVVIADAAVVRRLRRGALRAGRAPSARRRRARRRRPRGQGVEPWRMERPTSTERSVRASHRAAPARGGRHDREGRPRACARSKRPGSSGHAHPRSS